MGLIDAATAPLRYVLSGAEHEASAVQDLEDIQIHVLAAVEAIKDATDQVEAHVEVIETLANSLAPLTAAVTRLTAQMQSLPALVESVDALTEKLDVVVETLSPIAHAEQDVTKVGHLFSRRKLTPPADS
jgi:methyl-accepting chemotaxis protein